MDPELASSFGNAVHLEEREIMLFIGKPMGRSIMISNTEVQYTNCKV